MPRRRVALAPGLAQSAYEETGSVRAAAKRCRTTRWVMTSALTEAGIPIRPRTEAMEIRRFLAPSEPIRLRYTAREERWGTTTVVRFLRWESYVPCAWPACTEEATLAALCPSHFGAVPSHANCCAWPGCEQSPLSGGLCYAHSKRAEGLIS